MTTKYSYRRLLAVSFVALGLLGVVTFGGCGGGVQDPTEVALKPNKEEPAGGKGSGNGNGGGTQNGSATTPTEGYGSITGKIVLAPGDSVPAPGVRIAKGAAPVNPEFCAANKLIPDDSLVVNADNRGVANVFIYLSKNPTGGKETTASVAERPTIFDQINCIFVPHAMVMTTGKEITVKSQDPVPHNVHTLPLRSDAFNQVIDPTNKEGIPLTYNKPESVPCNVVCDFHKWMKAYHLPLDHPYAAVTDADGKFTISDLPSGTHQFVIWHEGKGYLERKYEVTVSADETNDVGEIPFGLNRFAQGEFRGPKPRVVNISLVQK